MQCTTEMRTADKCGDAQIASLYRKLQAVPDYRHKRGRRYEAATVMVIVLLAKMCGEESVSGIAEWARLREEWLKAELGLRRLPCANTYAYILTHLDTIELAAQIAAYFEQFERAEACKKRPLAQETRAWEHWALNGKVLRGSHRQAPPSQSGQEVLNVYAVKQGYLKHCQPIASKGYEAATAQAFLAQRDCVGKVITADALHTRPRFCRQIRRQQGEYVLIVKRNRPELEAEIRQLFALVPVAQLQAARALWEDAVRCEQEAKEEAAAQAQAAQQRERELQDQIDQLLRELGKTEGELEALRKSKPKGFWARLLGGGE